MKFLIALILLSLAFVAGILITHYQLFPYPQIKAVKQHFFPSEKETLQNYSYYSRKVSQHQLQIGQTFELLFVGDSLVDEADWAGFFPGTKVANLGINADTTGGVLARLKTIEGIASDKLFLMIGINDIFMGKKMDLIQENYQVIAEKLAKRKGEVYLFSCLFPGSSYSQYDQQVRRLNGFIKKLAEQQENMTYIELNSSLAPNERLNPNYTNDDVHLNGIAYQRWVDVLAPYINE